MYGINNPINNKSTINKGTYDISIKSEPLYREYGFLDSIPPPYFGCSIIKNRNTKSNSEFKLI